MATDTVDSLTTRIDALELALETALLTGTVTEVKYADFGEKRQIASIADLQAWIAELKRRRERLQCGRSGAIFPVIG